MSFIHFAKEMEWSVFVRGSGGGWYLKGTLDKRACEGARRRKERRSLSVFIVKENGPYFPCVVEWRSRWWWWFCREGAKNEIKKTLL